MGADEPDGGAPIVAGDDLALPPYPHVPAVLAQKPEFYSKPFALTCKIALNRTIGSVDVIGMNPFFPFIEIAWKRIGFIPGHGEIPVIEIYGSVNQIPIPDPVVCNRHGQIETVFAFGQFRLLESDAPVSMPQEHIQVPQQRR